MLTNQASNHRSKAYFSNFSNGVFLLGKTYYHYYMQHKYSLAAIELYSSALASKDKPSSETFNNIEYFFDNIYTDLERTHTDIKEYLSQNYISADEKNAALDKLSSSVSGFSADFMSELETSLDLNIMIKNNDPYKYETKWIDWISGISGGLNHVSFSKSSMSSGSKDPIEDPVLFLEYSNLKTKGAGSYTLYYKNLILYSEGYEPLSIPDGSFNIPNTSFGHAIDILAIAEEQYGDFDLDDFISKLTHISYNFCLKKGAEADVGEKSGTISASFNYGYTADSVENIELFSKPLAFDESYSYVIEEIPRIDTELLTWDSVFGFTFAVDCGNKENVNIGYYIEIEKKDNKDISVRYTPEKTFAHSAPFRFTSDFAEESFNQNDINKLKELISNLEKITVTVTLVQH